MSHAAPEALPGLGRRPADPARLARTVRLRLTGALPPHPPTADFLSAIRTWMLGRNDRFGTCGPTYVANSAVLTWHWLLGQEISVSDAAIIDLYRRSGNPDFDPDAPPDASGQVPGDNGVDMTVMLSALVKGGIEITHADGGTETIRPLAFAQHATDIDTVRAVTAIFGCDGFGLDLETAQQAQTRAGLWDYRQSGEWGGHATLGGSYTGSATAGSRDEALVTWARVVGTTDEFLARQLMEAYVVVWEPLWDHPAFQAGVDQAGLAADFESVTGRPFPRPVTPAPSPAPSPSPAPGGGTTADPADWVLASKIPHGWPGGHHVGDNGRVAAALETWLSAKHLQPGGAPGHG
jgi:hypothetical protein